MQNDVMFGILLSLLARPRKAQELAEKYEISTRTVYRYLDALEMGGVPLMRKQGRDGGFYLDSAHFIDKCYFSDKELSAAISLLRASALGNATVTSVADKLEALSGMKHDASYHLSPANIVIDTGTWFHGGDNTKVASLNSAIEETAILRLAYRDAYGHTTEREVEPHTLVLKDGVWYLYGYCLLRNAWRLFLITGIEDLQKTGKTFARRSYDTKNLPWQSLPTEEGEDCVMTFDASIATEIADKFGLDHIDGNTLRIRATLTPRLIATLASYGAKLRVLSPATLQQALRDFFQNALKNCD